MITLARLLRLSHGHADLDIPIRIFTPEQGDDGGWFCRCEIAWLHGRWSSPGWGFDAVQAILLTMQKIGTELYMSEHHKPGRLMWTAPGRGYGFPVSRNLLIGDDALEA